MAAKQRTRNRKRPAQATSARRAPELDVDDEPRLDRLPFAEAAGALGVTPAELRDLIASGFELTDPLTGQNNWLMSPAELVAEIGITTRQLRNLERRGLPSVGVGRRKRYPWPLAEAWYRVFRVRAAVDPGAAIEFLDPRDARSELDAALALRRAYEHLRRGRAGALDPVARDRLDEARRFVDRGEVPPDYGWR